MARYAGVDYGHKRVGLALSDLDGIIALPHSLLEVSDPVCLVERLRDFCACNEVKTLVMGLPLNMNGSHGPMAQRVECLVEALRSQLPVEVVVWPERLTSRQAERVLIEADMSRAKRRLVLDKLAAQLILQDFLDARNESMAIRNRDDDTTIPDDCGV